MPGLQPKKMLILNILEILKRHTDPEHPLTQKQIVNYLESDYEMVVERKAVKRNLTELMEAGYPIYAKSETTRCKSDPFSGDTDENTMLSGFYYEHEFTDGEVRMMIDSVLFSKTIPPKFAEDLIQKISKLGSRHHEIQTKHLTSVNAVNRTPALEVFFVIEKIEEAISGNKKLSFFENKYEKDKKLHRVTQTPEVVIPKQLIAADGYYYLVAFDDNQNKIKHFRIDKLTEINLLEASSAGQYRCSFQPKDFANYIDSHSFMSSGTVEKIVMRVSNDHFDDVVDSFGPNFRIIEESEEVCIIELKSTLKGMYQWALLHGNNVEILKPQKLRERLCLTTSKMHSSYFATDDDRYNAAIRMATSPYTSLQIHDIDLSHRESFREISGLKHIDLSRNCLHDIEFVRNQNELTNLYINSNTISDFSPIIGLPRIQELRLWNTGVRDISFLTTLPRLRRLMIHETDIQNIEVLYELKLAHLWLSEETICLLDMNRLREICPHVTIWRRQATQRDPKK